MVVLLMVFGVVIVADDVGVVGDAAAGIGVGLVLGHRGGQDNHNSA